MDVNDQLLLIIEVSVALAGFAGIIATFQFRDSGRKTRGNVLGVATIVNMSLVVAVVAFLPILLEDFGVSDQTKWSLSTGTVAILYLIFLARIRSHMSRVKISGINRLVINTWWTINISVMVVLALRAFNQIFPEHPGPFMFALVNPLCFVGYMFSRLLLRPLWKTVRENESAEST